MHAVTLALLMATTLQSVGAQDSEPGRGNQVNLPLIGTARLADSKPWAGARVRLRPAPAGARTIPEQVDELAVLTDSMGRFRASMVPGRRYVVIAEQELADDALLVSRELVHVAGAARIELRAEDAPRPSTRLRFSGLDPAAPRPLSLTAISLALQERWTLALDADDATTLPPSAASDLELGVFDAGGRLLRCALFSELHSEPGSDAVLAAAREHWIRVHAVSFAGKRPLAGAVFARCFDGRFHDLATCDADGIARLDLASTATDSAKTLPVLFVLAARHDLGLLRIAEPQPRTAAELAGTTGFDAELEIVGRLGPWARGRILADERPLAELDFEYEVEAGNGLFDLTNAWQRVALRGRSDAEGRYVLPHDDSDQPLLRILADDRLLAAMPEAWRAGFGNSLLLRLPGRVAPIELELLDHIALIELRLLRPAGDPAADVDIHAGPLDALGLHQVRSDRAGRAVLAVPTIGQSPILLGAIGEAGWRVVSLGYLRESDPDAPPQQLVITLREPLALDVRVAAAPGQALREELSVGMVCPRPVWLGGGVSTVPARDTSGIPCADVDDAHVHSFVADLQLEAPLVDGRARLCVPKVDGEFQVQVRAGPAHEVLATTTLHVEAARASEPLLVELQLTR
jgi:hypothetical protein